LRAGSLEQLTTDHSLVAELVSSGVLTPEEAERHPQRSAITRALGTEPAVDVEVLTIAGEPGDLYLICSDGLPTMLADSAVAAALEAAERDPAVAAEALVAAANRQGGEDNITVVLFELAEGEPPAHEPAAIVPEPVTDDPVPQEQEPELEQEPEVSPASLSRHGAGSGGRLAALAFIVAVLVIAGLVLYWGISK
jgi:protein phosphatase